MDCSIHWNQSSDNNNYHNNNHNNNRHPSISSYYIQKNSKMHVSNDKAC